MAQTRHRHLQCESGTGTLPDSSWHDLWSRTGDSDPALLSVIEVAAALLPPCCLCLTIRTEQQSEHQESEYPGAWAGKLLALHEQVPQPWDDPRVYAYTTLPIVVGRNTQVGTLHLWRPTEDLPWSADVQEGLSRLTQLAGQTIQNAQLQQEAKRSLNQLFVVHEAVRLFNSSESPAALLEQALLVVKRTLPFVHCGIWLLDGETMLVLRAACGLAAPALSLDDADPEIAWSMSVSPDVLSSRDGSHLQLDHSHAQAVLDSEIAQEYHPPYATDRVIPLLDNGSSPQAILSAPLVTRQGPRGVLEAYTAEPHVFSDDEHFTLSVLAAEAAVALDNVLLTQNLRDKEQRLTMFAQKLVQSQEEERRRIARDIHDGLAQTIVSAYQLLQAYRYSLPQRRTAASSKMPQFDHGLEVLRSCIDESRAVLNDLRPTLLDDFGLIQALEQYLRTLATQEGWQADFQVRGSFEGLSPTLETTVYRLVQEALTNVKKHAQTPRVRVDLARVAHRILISIQDWGIGFSTLPPHIANDEGRFRRTSSRHLGVVGMRERVALAQGEYAIHSSPGEGTTVSIILPDGLAETAMIEAIERSQS